MGAVLRRFQVAETAELINLTERGAGFQLN